MARDEVEFYVDIAGEWRWRRFNGGNHREVAGGGEGYEHLDDCADEALTVNGNGCVYLFPPGSVVEDGFPAPSKVKEE